MSVIPVRYLNSELNLNLADVQLLIVAVVVELSVVLHQLCLPNTLYHALRGLDNLVDKGSYHVVLFVHGIVFFRIAVVMILYFSFCYTLLLFDVVAAAGAAVLRIVAQLPQLLNLGGIERGDRLEDNFLAPRYSAVLAKFYYIDTHHLLYLRKIDVDF